MVDLDVACTSEGFAGIGVDPEAGIDDAGFGAGEGDFGFAVADKNLGSRVLAVSPMYEGSVLRVPVVFRAAEGCAEE